MASNEYFKAVKSTEEAAKATAAATAFNIGMSAVMQARITATQRAQLAEAERAAAAAEAAYDVQLQALGEQRAHNYAMWRQTADGQVYEAWKDRAWLLITAIKARDASFYDAFDADVAAIREQQKAVREPEPPMSGGRAALWLLFAAGALSVVVGIVLGILALLPWLFTLGRQESDLTAVGVFCGAGVAAMMLGLLVPADEETRAWRRRSRAAAEQAAKDRIERFGFDPNTELGKVPAHWTFDAGLVDRLRARMDSAHVEHPAPQDLPVLRLPEVRDPQSEPHEATRAMLVLYRAEAVAPS